MLRNDRAGRAPRPGGVGKSLGGWPPVNHSSPHAQSFFLAFGILTHALALGDWAGALRAALSGLACVGSRGVARVARWRLPRFWRASWARKIAGLAGCFWRRVFPFDGMN